jgi:hypothetical protein
MKVILNPKFTRNIIELTLPKTEKLPLIAQANGTAFSSSAENFLIPYGKGIPTQNPIGRMISPEIKYLLSPENFIKSLAISSEKNRKIICRIKIKTNKLGI